MYRVFIVEDDVALADLTKKYLETWGYEVFCAHDLRNITSEFSAFHPHIVLLDIMLPFYDGYYWCTEIRKLSSVPIIFVTSAKDDMNLIMAINMGGDDFIAKPFDTRVLMAKLQALLRRTYDLQGTMSVIEHKGAVLNLNDHSFTYRDKKLELTKNEFRILEVLLLNKGKVISRDTLMTKLWQDDCYVEENTLTVNVTRLRKKLEGIGLADFIKTKVGSGYIVGI